MAALPLSFLSMSRAMPEHFFSKSATFLSKYLALIFGLPTLPSGSVFQHLGEGTMEEVVDRSGLPGADSVEPLAPVHVLLAE
jgi:hypothetical protein